MTNTWYALDWDQAYHPSYAKICCTVICHIQVHLYFVAAIVQVVILALDFICFIWMFCCSYSFLEENVTCHCVWLVNIFSTRVEKQLMLVLCLVICHIIRRPMGRLICSCNEPIVMIYTIFRGVILVNTWKEKTNK